MKRWLSTPLLIAGIVACSVDVFADGIADRRSEQATIKLVPLIKSLAPFTEAEIDILFGDRLESGLTYSTGQMRETHPQLTAHKLKRLAVDNY